jgi:retinol dehydrogenase-12
MSGELDGKLCVVTGGTSGIGRATAILLGRAGASLVLVGRSAAHGREAAAAVTDAGASAVDVLLGDLSERDEVRRIADQILCRHRRVHALVNNAGGLFLWRQLIADGVEMTWALNHLSYFLLTALLRDRLLESAPARVVNVASEAHASGVIKLDDPGRLRGARAYQQSKLANVLFTRALAKRLHGTGVTVNAVHPGRVDSGFGSNNGWIWRLVRPIVHRNTITPEEGAIAVARLVADPRLDQVSGRYFDSAYEAAPAPQAMDDTLAERLWTLSEQSTRPSET